MRSLIVLFDESCALCVRCRDWIEGQDGFLPIQLVASGSANARARFGEVPWLGRDLVVVSDEGDVWAGSAAFIMCLWALREWREWSYRLSGPTLAPVADRFFHALSSKRHTIAAMMWRDPCDDDRCDVARHRVPPTYR